MLAAVYYSSSQVLAHDAGKFTPDAAAEVGATPMSWFQVPSMGLTGVAINGG